MHMHMCVCVCVCVCVLVFSVFAFRNALLRNLAQPEILNPHIASRVVVFKVLEPIHKGQALWILRNDKRETTFNKSPHIKRTGYFPCQICLVFPVPFRNLGKILLVIQRYSQSSRLYFVCRDFLNHSKFPTHEWTESENLWYMIRLWNWKFRHGTQLWQFCKCKNWQICCPLLVKLGSTGVGIFFFSPALKKKKYIVHFLSFFLNTNEKTLLVQVTLVMSFHKELLFFFFSLKAALSQATPRQFN